MQQQSLVPAATLVALFSVGCAVGVGSQDSQSLLTDGGGPNQSTSGGSSSSGGSGDGPGLNSSSGGGAGDNGSVSATGGSDAGIGDGGSFTVTGGDDASSPSGPASGGSSSGSSSGGVTATFTDGDAGKVYATLPYRGFSMAGAEFGPSFGGLFNGPSLGKMPGDYYYPTTDLAKGGPTWPTSSKGMAIETDLMDPYFLGAGMNTIRLPLRWERLQHSLSSTSGAVLTGSQVVATFDATELAALKTSVSTLTRAGFTVLIDIHNYAYYTSASEIASSQGGDPLGSANVPNVAFENLWIGLASIYANDPKVVFDIMNEPNTPPDPSGKPAGYEWYLAAQAAVTGIRSIGATNLILICGNDFAGAGDFTSAGWSDPLQNIKDPGSNFAFEVHAYPDTGYGTADTCTTGSGGSIQGVLDSLQTFVTWAQKYKARGFLGEFSAGTDVSADANCDVAIGQMLTLLTQNSSIFLGWTYWAAGAGFGSNEPLNYGFFNSGKVSPQMKALAQFLQ